MNFNSITIRYDCSSAAELSRFDIIKINGFNTSKLYNKTLKEMENISVKRKT